MPDSVPMIRMSDVQQTAVHWLWYPYIPFGKLTILQGNPGEGKTYFAMYLTAACTNRQQLPNGELLEPFNVIYQTAEDGLGDTVKPRLIEAGADLDRVLVIDDRESMLTLTDKRIERAIRENQAKLLIIDPIQAFLGAQVDMNRANEVRPIFRALGEIAEAPRLRYFDDRSSQQSVRLTKHLSRAWFHRHDCRRAQSPVHRQGQGRPHHAGADA